MMNAVDQYIQKYDEETQKKLNTIRETALELAPNATEWICMGIPTLDLNGKWLLHFAAYKKHIGFYPDPETIEAFKSQLKDYKISKGTIQFPLNKPLPMDLIREMIVYRVQSLQNENG